ncbi:MAG: lipocalin family protein [Pseudomonadota bacterium]
MKDDAIRSDVRGIRRLALYGVSAIAAAGVVACSSVPVQGPIATASYVDLERFMGDWYVIASIPTFLEDDIYNAVESYELDEDGNIATTFTFRKGGFDGKQKTYTPKGFVKDEQSNAVWGMRFLWPFKADYRVVFVDDNYETTIIGRNKRDYVWIMARAPQLDESTYAGLVATVEKEGYDISELRTVPQRWD